VGIGIDISSGVRHCVWKSEAVTVRFNTKLKIKYRKREGVIDSFVAVCSLTNCPSLAFHFLPMCSVVTTSGGFEKNSVLGAA
jgi:hypothetical protein